MQISRGELERIQHGKASLNRLLAKVTRLTQVCASRPELQDTF